MQPALARKQPGRLLFSGLAGGILGGRYTGHIMDEPNLISFDMGGTSTDVALITQGEVSETTEGKIGELPCGLPMIDVETVRRFYRRLNHQRYGLTELAAIDKDAERIVATGFFDNENDFLSACRNYNRRWDVYAGRSGLRPDRGRLARNVSVATI